MAKLKSTLQDAVKSTAVVQTSSGNVIKLRERQADMSVEITGAETQLVALNLEKIGHLPGIRENCGLDRICDYLLIARSGKTCYAVFVELKRTYRRNDDSYEQLRRSLPILKYLVSVVEIEHEQNLVGLEVRYVLICERLDHRIDKQHLKVKKRGIIERDDRGLITINKYLGSRHNFKDLIS